MKNNNSKRPSLSLLMYALIIFSAVLFLQCSRADLPVPESGGPAGSLNGLRWQILSGTSAGTNVDNVVDPPVVTTTMGGTAGQVYSVVLRFRGVVEQKTYYGGTTDGYFNAGGTPAEDAFNIYELSISSPQSVYYLNNGTSNIYNCFALDYQETIVIDGGATISLIAMAVDGHQISNVDASGNPIVVPGIPPAPAAYHGQFIQMDVISVK